MYFPRTLFSVAAFAVAVLAQNIAFTSVPTSVTVGQTYDITWSGGDSSPVTIILRSGSSNNLQTISTITTTATGGSFQWTPASNIPDGSDYALEIEQGSDINYSPMFSITGGTAAAASSSAAAIISSQVSALSSMASSINSVASSINSMSSSGSMTTTTSASSTSSSSKSTSAATKTASGSTSSVPTGGAASFGANQVILALGAVAAMLY